MLNKIQTKIESLGQGKKLILGTGIQLDEMQKVVALCEELQSSGQIKIVPGHGMTTNCPQTIALRIAQSQRYLNDLKAGIDQESLFIRVLQA